MMKGYKKVMDFIAGLEKWILVLSTVLILVLTVGNVLSRKLLHRSWSFTEELVVAVFVLITLVANVLSRKLLHRSWSFTEELVVAVFVLITLVAAALACREGELVSLPLLTDRLPKKSRKPVAVMITVLSVAFTAVLFRYGLDKVLTQLENGKRTFVLNWPEWIFWSFIPIGAGCMVLHFIEYCLDVCTDFQYVKKKGEV